MALRLASLALAATGALGVFGLAASGQAAAQDAVKPETAKKADKPLNEPTPLAERVATLVVLDKFTSTTHVFEVNPGSVVSYGRLRIAVRSCEAAPPWDRPESAAFLQVDEQGRQGGLKRVYSGWMFARAASLHPFEHAAYNVSLRSCKMSFPDKGEDTVVVSEPRPAPAPAPEEASPVAEAPVNAE